MLENKSLSDRLPICLLYVEDEESIRTPMLEMLKRRIDRIIVAKDGQEGLESFINYGADVVLSDLKMPNMNGLQMISEIKKIAPDTKTVIVSAYSDTEFFQQALELGVDGFLLKPVQRIQLINTVNRVSESILSLKKAKVNEEMFLSLATSASDAIIMIGNDGLISFWNPAAEKIFGQSSQEVHDQPFTLVFAPQSLPKDWPSDYKGMPDFIRNNPPSSNFFELLGIRNSGELFPTEVSISPVHIDDYWHATFIVRDISERKQREADLIKARENAEEASMARQRFLSVMSHEIRTPLNGIIGTANLLSQEDPREDQKEYLETLVFSGNHLLSLINDILDFSKIEANKIEFEQLDFDLKELVSGVIKIFDYKAADKGISLTAELDTQIPMFLKGDTVRLNQILTNLIGNAIKFTEKGEVKVLVKTKNLSESSITCKFEIIDTGIGIPQDKIHSIFDLFSQADTNTTRKFGGTGLGLAITYKLIELQRGKIEVQSEVGVGSNFTFELTFNRSAKKIEPNSTTVDNLKSLEGIRVLLVEDNKINQMIATKFLLRWNAVVTLAENGLEALEHVQQQKHDIVLMDLQMPLMDGYEAASQIRKLDGPYFRNIPIIALTASALIEVKEGITRAGMNDIVSKPFIPDELNNKIFEYVNKP